MTHRWFSFPALLGLLGLIALVAAGPLRAAPYAAMVMDARTGEVLHSRNADTRLHPASLTKMMTLYIVFEAVRLGEISMDTLVPISRNAAATPYAIGFRAGTSVELRHLVRAAAVRSSNDAATAIAEAISGSEAAFARRMNRTARALGLSRTTFRNAHGLTEEGHLSTARDMTVMGRRLFYDYNQYYNIFGRTSTYAGPVGTVANTNRRVLNAYRGADGIKTGYTRAAGFNLVSSAERDGVRIIATVFGGNSGPTRNARIIELLDMGFDRAPPRVTERPPAMPAYEGDGDGGTQGRVIRMSGAVTRSLRPQPRPGAPVDIPAELVAAIEDSVGAALSEALEPEVAPDAISDAVAEADSAEPLPEIAFVAPGDPISPDMAAAIDEVLQDTAPEQVAALDPEPEPPFEVTDDGTVLLSGASVSATRPRPRPVDVTDIVARAAPLEPEVVTRSTSGGSRLYGVSLGQLPTQNEAERLLLTTALADLGTFDEALRHVANRGDGFEARFAGMTESQAIAACARLAARSMACEPFGPS